MNKETVMVPVEVEGSGELLDALMELEDVNIIEAIGSERD